MAIQLATGSKFSHVGLIVIRRGAVFVCEAVQPVKYTPLSEWIKRGKNGGYCVKRLISPGSAINRGTVEKYYAACEKHIGRDYDLYFNWSGETIYCSELVWKVYKDAFGIELCRTRKLKDFNIKNKTVKSKMAERYGKDIPLNEPVVSPSDLFGSKKLVTIECK